VGEVFCRTHSTRSETSTMKSDAFIRSIRCWFRLLLSHIRLIVWSLFVNVKTGYMCSLL
jgi:hypothetical protein